MRVKIVPTIYTQFILIKIPTHKENKYPLRLTVAEKTNERHQVESV